MSYITQILGTGTSGYFADASNHPRLLIFDNNEGLASRAGEWNGAGGGTYQQDFDRFFSVRSSQGFAAWIGPAWSNSEVYSDALSYGRTWDGTYPFTIDGTPGQISAGTLDLNDAFWARIDYMFTAAAANDMLCWLNLAFSYDFGVTSVFANATSTQLQQFGAALATRYPQSDWPNVQWMFGDDSGAGTNDAACSSILAGIQSAGDTRSLITYEYEPETNSHVRFSDGAVFYPGGFGVTNATVNWCYDYHNPYIALEASYTESGTTPIPPIYGDGLWYGDVGADSADYTVRRAVWWSLASGARGVTVTSGPGPANVWRWDSGASAALTSDPIGPFCTSTIGTIAAYFTSLRGWHQLIPDTGNALITAGRGTRSPDPSPDNYYPKGYGDGVDYVAGSITGDGGLAVIYCAQHFSITIDPSKMAAGYGVKWVDPSSCAITAGTPGTTYNSTPLGNNSAGDPDWVLILASPPYATWKVP